MLLRYSALDANTPRAAEVRAYPWGNHPGKSESWNRRWQRLRDHATRIVAGEVADPCGADHFGARDIPVDVERAERAIRAGKWARIRCGTKNAMYRVVTRAPQGESGTVIAASVAAGREGAR